jgi:UDP-N-acetylmuramyl pentapeptide phosphotransferase/UDP-N-acetylglucosamine-1-phosphate transferase
LTHQALAALAAVLGAGGVLALLLGRASSLPLDRAGVRSLHQGAIPRGGGLSILAGAAVGALVAPPVLPGAWFAWALALGAVAAISQVDDVRPLPASLRLAVHLGAAIAVASAILGAGAPAWLLASALVIVWGANLFNFMDGSDGLAATMALAGFLAYAAGAAHAGAPWGALAGFATASLPFLLANRPPARIFMGDAGSVTLGFAAAALGLAGVASTWWPAWFPPLVFLPFLADATVTLGLRALRGERVWTPHRSHFYQRLNLAGAGHRGTLAIYAGAMLACATLALACLVLRPEAGLAALGAALAGHAVAFAAIDYHAKKACAPKP